MPVYNGQDVSEEITNPAFLDAQEDDTAAGKISFHNIDAVSGANIDNIQRNINAICSAMGISPNQVYNYLYGWANSIVGLTTSSSRDKIEALVNRFLGTGGHAHNGTDGEASKVSAYNLVDLNFFTAQWQQVSIPSALGTSMDISTPMTGKVADGGVAQLGVITVGANNRVWIIDASTETFLEDAEGQRVYGRITYLAGVWTLSFYTNEAGVETAYNLSSTNITVFFLEVFDQSSRPTIPSNPALFGTLDITADVIDASVTHRGLINILTQAFAGNKTFTGVTTVSNLTNSTVNTDGALIVSGGVGIAKSLFIGMVLDVLGSCFLGKTEVRDTTQSTDKDTGALVVQGGVGIEKNLNVGGNAIITGDLTVNGTTTTLNTQTLDVEDQNITVNILGNDVSAEGAGLTVNRTGTDGSLAYQDSLASKWKVGALAAESEVLTAATNQTITGEKLHTAKLTLQSQVVFDEQVDGASSGANVTLPTPSKFYYTITNGALTSISGVTALSKDSFLLVNKTGGTVVLKYDAGTIAADGLLNGAGSDIPMRDGSSLFFIYSPTAARWVIIGAFVSSENKNEAIAAGGSFTKPTGFSASYLVSSTGGEVDTSTTPLGAVAPPADGTEVTFTGFHLTNIVTFLTSDIAKGFILNGTCRLPKYSTLTVKYILALDRWVEKSRSQYGI